MSTAFVRIKSGAYRTTDVSGRLFQLVEQYKTGVSGGFVTVMNNDSFPGMPDKLRIKVDNVAAYEFVSGEDFLDVPVIVEDEPVVHHHHDNDSTGYSGDSRSSWDSGNNTGYSSDSGSSSWSDSSSSYSSDSSSSSFDSGPAQF